MANVIKKYYQRYLDTAENFKKFHNQVINMPRDSFSNNDFIKIRSICSYIKLIDESDLKEPMNYVSLLDKIRNKIALGVFPPIEFRDVNFEQDYLLSTLDDNIRRMFRHNMALILFFGVIKNYQNRSKKIIDLDILNSILLATDEVLADMFRHIMLDIDIKNNSFISNLNGINLDSNTASYKPCINILRYCRDINRPATLFEISILLGRIDEVQVEKDIFNRAITVGKTLPQKQEDQIKFFFGHMGWNNFSYAPSQQPYFKFYTFFIYLELFGFVNINKHNQTITLTEYATELLENDIPAELLDLERLLSRIDDDSENLNELADIVLRTRTPVITKAIQDDGELLVKFNKRNIRKPIIRKNKRQRSKLIAELAKIKANYTDEVTGGTTFKDKYGNNYVEAHHIIEFNGDNGPDITDNLICLGPLNHMSIHRGSEQVVSDFFNTCKTRGVITFERFKNICVKYRCLTKEHVKVLLDKNLISSLDANELNTLIDEHGVDSDFLATLKTPASTSDLV